MSKIFDEFISTINRFLSDFRPDEVFEYIDDFWFENEDNLIYIPNPSVRTEYDVVDDIFLLADQYNPSPKIVESDPYCIGPEDFKKGLIEILKQNNLLHSWNFSRLSGRFSF